MTELRIDVSQFPKTFAHPPQIGETITVQITGVIFKIEDDLVDVTTYGGPPRITTGRRIVEITVTEMTK